MKKHILLVGIGLVFCTLPSFAAETAESKDGFKNESEAGIVITNGNSKSQSFNFKQLNTYVWTENLFRFDGKYLKTSAKGIESARQWNLGLRYERALTDALSIFVAQGVESDVFAGTKQRYNSDVGAKYAIVKSKDLELNTELGYRYSKENRMDGTDESFNLGRAYAEAIKPFNEQVTGRLNVEYLYDFENSNNYNLNSEAALLVSMTSILSLKTGFSVKYDNEPNPGIAKKSDTVLTTALVAKF